MVDEKQAQHPKICRICLGDHVSDDPIENTLISPCACKGTCEHVHLKCLKQWLDSKKSRVENSNHVCLTFNFKKISCEICKEALPYSIKLEGGEYDIVDIKSPVDAPYIILEKIENTKENRGLYLIKSSTQQVKIVTTFKNYTN